MPPVDPSVPASASFDLEEWAELSGFDSDAAAATTGASVLRGSAWSAFSMVLPQIFTLVVSIAAARVLTPGQMGAQSFISFVLATATQLASAGLNQATTRFVAELAGRNRPDAIRLVLRWMLRIEIALAILMAGATLVVGRFVGDNRASWVLAAIIVIPAVLHAVPSAALRGLQRFRDATIAGLVTGGFGTVLAVAALIAGYGIVGIFAVTFLVAISGLVWTWILARRAWSTLPEDWTSPILDLAPRYARFAGIASLETVLAIVVWRRSEFFFLEAFSTNTQIALYSIAFAFVAALAKLPEALEAVLAPAFATLYGASDTERIKRAFVRAIRLVTTVSVLLTAAGIALGPLMIKLVYGPKYAGTAPVVLLMMISFPVVPMLAVSNGVLSGLGRIRVVVIYSSIAAIVDIGLAVALVPKFGAVGAASANLAAQLAVAIPVVVATQRMLGRPRWEIARLGRAVLAAIVTCVAAALVTQAWPTALGLLVASIVLGVTALVATRVFRVVSGEDVEWAAGAVRGRRGALITRCGQWMVR